jgi:hypothetical protein
MLFYLERKVTLPLHIQFLFYLERKVTLPLHIQCCSTLILWLPYPLPLPPKLPYLYVFSSCSTLNVKLPYH